MTENLNLSALNAAGTSLFMENLRKFYPHLSGHTNHDVITTINRLAEKADLASRGADYFVEGANAADATRYQGGMESVTPDVNPYAHCIGHVLGLGWYEGTKMEELRMVRVTARGESRFVFSMAGYKEVFEKVAQQEALLPATAKSQALSALAIRAADCQKLVTAFESSNLRYAVEKPALPEDLCGTGFTYRQLMVYLARRSNELQLVAGEKFYPLAGHYSQFSHALAANPWVFAAYL